MNRGLKATKKVLYICESMARKKELSKDRKHLIVKRLKGGIYHRKVTQTFACAPSTLCKILKKYRLSNDAKYLHRNGRPRTTTSRQDRKFSNFAKNMQSCKSKLLNAKWSKCRVKV